MTRPLVPSNDLESHKPEESASGTPSPLVHQRRKAPRQLAKSADPAYMKFTTYIQKTTHLRVKARLVSKEKELSDLVEDLLFNWPKENDSFA